jgi:hypothetical protein
MLFFSSFLPACHFLDYLEYLEDETYGQMEDYKDGKLPDGTKPFHNYRYLEGRYECLQEIIWLYESSDSCS